MRKRKKRPYSGRLFTRETVWVTGDRMEIHVYPVFQKPGKRRAKSKSSSEVQARLNERNSMNEAIRVAEANFGPGDYALHLTYAKEPESIEEAQRLLGNFLRRLARRYRKAGLVLKWLKRTETGKKNGRVHHHLLISGGLGRDEIESLWEHGRANSRRLQFDRTEGIESLVKYITGKKKATGHRARATGKSEAGDAGDGLPRSCAPRNDGTGERDTYRRWSCSRSCVRPQPEQHDGRMTMEAADELGAAAEEGRGYAVFEELYPGWECVECTGMKNEINKGWYTYAVLRRRE